MLEMRRDRVRILIFKKQIKTILPKVYNVYFKQSYSCLDSYLIAHAHEPLEFSKKDVD